MNSPIRRISLIRYSPSSVVWLGDAFRLVYGLECVGVDTDSDDPSPLTGEFTSYFHSYRRRGTRSLTIELITPTRPPEDFVYVPPDLRQLVSPTTWLAFIDTTDVPQIHDWIAARLNGEILDVGIPPPNESPVLDIGGDWKTPVRGVVVPPPPPPAARERRGCLLALFGRGPSRVPDRGRP